MGMSFEIDIITPDGGITATFSQASDESTRLDAPWRVVAASRATQGHVSTIATSKEAGALMIAHGAEYIDDVLVTRGIARLYRRNVVQILGVPNASITIGIEHLEVFAPMERADPSAHVEIEVENLAVDLALLAAGIRASPTLSAPIAWKASGPALSAHRAYDAMCAFYDEYENIRSVLAEPSLVVPAARRGIAFAAVALFESRVPPFLGVNVTSTAPSNLINGDMTIEVTVIGGVFSCVWRGKSSERDPAEILRPWFAQLLDTVTVITGSIEMHFEQIERLNSSTITALIKFIQMCRKHDVPLVMVYDQTLKWQRLSFDALRVFEKGDDLFHLRQA